MNILMPMVLSNTLIGDESGYIKVLFEIKRKTILEYILERLAVIPNARFHFVVRRSDIKTHHIDSIIKLLLPAANIVVAQGETKGSACSCLLAVDAIGGEEPLMIVGSDQIINRDLTEIVNRFASSELDGGAVIFEDVHPRWSFVRLDESGFVIEAAEKRPISKNACAGYYYFRSGRIFLNAAMQMIRKREPVNEQYYVCPVFNEMIVAGQKIGVCEINKSDYFSLTSEKGMEDFESHIEHAGRQTRR
jgi:dTDP-glucose pyrophosphorylase